MYATDTITLCNFNRQVLNKCNYQKVKITASAIVCQFYIISLFSTSLGSFNNSVNASLPKSIMLLNVVEIHFKLLPQNQYGTLHKTTQHENFPLPVDVGPA